MLPKRIKFSFSLERYRRVFITECLSLTSITNFFLLQLSPSCLRFDQTLCFSFVVLITSCTVFACYTHTRNENLRNASVHETLSDGIPLLTAAPFGTRIVIKQMRAFQKQCLPKTERSLCRLQSHSHEHLKGNCSSNKCPM